MLLLEPGATCRCACPPSMARPYAVAVPAAITGHGKQAGEPVSSVMGPIPRYCAPRQAPARHCVKYRKPIQGFTAAACAESACEALSRARPSSIACVGASTGKRSTRQPRRDAFKSHDSGILHRRPSTQRQGARLINSQAVGLHDDAVSHDPVARVYCSTSPTTTSVLVTRHSCPPRSALTSTTSASAFSAWNWRSFCHSLPEAAGQHCDFRLANTAGMLAGYT